MQAFELKNSINFHLTVLNSGSKTVMASLVGLEGSSYRKPGVRMLIDENGTMCGALSGGCVENEIVASAQSVFKTGKSKVISYDGRYRLGCVGFLYILIEPFELSNEDAQIVLSHLKNRNPIQIVSKYKTGETEIGDFYSEIKIDGINKKIRLNHLHLEIDESINIFKQIVQPAHHLIIIGTTHDVGKLCTQASLIGWDISIISSLLYSKNQKDFPDAKQIIAETPETISFDFLDINSSVVLMTHNYAQDLHYLLKLKNMDIEYIGVLGSKKRKASLENDLVEHDSEINEEFLNRIHSPAGLDIGAVTPEEIAVSIISEILLCTKISREIALSTSNLKAIS